MSLDAVENAISNLANYMRLYSEAHFRFGSLFDIDREEAIHNLERAFEAKLEAFHTLYDVSKDHFPYINHVTVQRLLRCGMLSIIETIHYSTASCRSYGYMAIRTDGMVQRFCSLVTR